MVWWYRFELNQFSKFIDVNLSVGWDLNWVNCKIAANLNYKESWLDLSRRALSENMYEYLDKNQCFNSIFHSLGLLMKLLAVYACWKLPRNRLFNYWLKFFVVKFPILFWNEKLWVLDDAEHSVALVTHGDDERVCKVDEYLNCIVVPFLQLEGILYVIGVHFAF